MWRSRTAAGNYFWRFLRGGIFVLLVIYPVFANASFGIRLEGDRSSITHDVKAGNVINETIIIDNPDAETRVNLFPVDRFKSTDGTYIPTSKYEKTSLFGKWIGPPVILALPARTKYAHSFTMTIPKDVVNGTYYGAIILHEVPKIATEGNIVITSNVGMSIKITVTGGRTEQITENTIQAVQTKPPEQLNKTYSETNWSPQVAIATPISVAPIPTDPISIVTPSPTPKNEPLPLYEPQTLQEDLSTTKKYGSWDFPIIFALIFALLFTLILIVRKR